MFHFINLVKYMLEGIAVAIAAFYIPQKNMNLKEIAIIALTAAAVFAVLDVFSPLVGRGARQGSGFGIGYNLVTGGGAEDAYDVEESEEPFDDMAGGADEPSAHVEAPVHETEVDADDNVPQGQDLGENYAML